MPGRISDALCISIHNYRLRFLRYVLYCYELIWVRIWRITEDTHGRIKCRLLLYNEARLRSPTGG